MADFVYLTLELNSLACMQAHIEAELLPVTNHLKALGYGVTLVVDFGKDPLKEILQTITHEYIDLVAMSTKAHDGLKRFFFGDLVGEVRNPSV